jgi:hypothetical protein
MNSANPIAKIRSPGIILDADLDNYNQNDSANSKHESKSSQAN